MPRTTHRTRRPLAFAAAAALTGGVALGAAGGAFGVVSATNDVLKATFDGGGPALALDLQTAPQPTTGGCPAVPEAAWLSSPDVPITVDSGPTFANKAHTICVRNRGTMRAYVGIGIHDLVDRELECTGDEAAFDTTCGGNRNGEVGELVRIEMAKTNGVLNCPLGANAPTTCTSSTYSPIEPGAIGSVYLGIYNAMPAATPAQRLAAQTDRLTFTATLHGDLDASALNQRLGTIRLRPIQTGPNPAA